MQGKVIQGRYRLARLLGKGSMGSVWLAEHLSLHTPVAIKLIDAEAAKNPNARARFDREAQVAARIRSAHVVKMLDHGVTEAGQPYIAMECLAGESLRERLAARGRLTPAEVWKVISHVCRALARAHEAGLVHRDLKPENIFIAREDDDEVVKILDFGVAKVTDAIAFTTVDPTRTGALLGTPFYMSPEQAQGLKTVDFRADLWSLAVVAFESLTGERPFSASALGPLIAKILGAPIPVPSQVAPEARLPPELDAWMARALSRDPAARFGSAKQLADAFVLAVGVADTLDRSLSTIGTSRTVVVPRAEAEDMVQTLAVDSLEATRQIDSSPPETPATPFIVGPQAAPNPGPAKPAAVAVAPPASERPAAPMVGASPPSTPRAMVVLVALVVVLGAAVVALLLLR
jgi:serine/threonine-protein kinase